MDLECRGSGRGGVSERVGGERCGDERVGFDDVGGCVCG